MPSEEIAAELGTPAPETEEVNEVDSSHEPSVRVSALHALVYCERLFYLEEVEEIRVADARVFAGRTLHQALEADDDDAGSVERLELASKELGIHGRVDAIRRRDGKLMVIEHKRGRAAKTLTKPKKSEAWATDRVQAVAYAMLLEQARGEPAEQARVRYHADNVTVKIAVDEAARDEVRAVIARARELRSLRERPPVSQDEKRCVRCSLAPVCLPEEERLARDPEWEPLNLAIADDERTVVHVVSHGSKLGRSGEEVVVTPREAPKTKLPVNTVAHVVLHGGAQISTQALHLCAEKNVAVTWVTGGGRFVGTLASGAGMVQRRVRQYRALASEEFCLTLAKTLVHAKVEGQLRFVLRATRGEELRATRETLVERVAELRRMLHRTQEAKEREVLLGIEGEAARSYFACWTGLQSSELDARLMYVGRTRRPPTDRVSALLGFGYALLLADVTAAIVGVGLEPSLGFYHQPRSAAPPLALDMMELFRVPLVDMPVMGSLNRGQWDADADFAVTGQRVWLSETGRRKMIDVYERRKGEEWKHTVVGYSLSYARMMELEVRLLEKEWMGAGGLFAKFRLR